MRVAVLIPTFNEENTIQFVTKQIDESLCKHFNKSQNYIVNCDSDSNDHTRQIFLNTKTCTEKISINTHQKGKGNNIITFFKFCIENKIDYAATIDGDIKSINDKWVKQLIFPLINGANYVVPFYKRGKYDGNLTNQFVFPITCLFSNVYIRQPIGGEFGFDKKFINLFMNTNFYGSEGFGIDICMTLCAIANNLNINVANLGEKCHKPGINNMKKMIREVSEVLFINLQKLNLSYKNCVIPYNCTNIYSYFDEEFVKKDRGKEMINVSLGQLRLDKYKIYLEQFDLSIDKYISSEIWASFLAKFLSLKQYTPVEFDFFTEIAIIRTVNYWNEIEKKDLQESENVLFDYIALLHHYIKQAKGDVFNER